MRKMEIGHNLEISHMIYSLVRFIHLILQIKIKVATKQKIIICSDPHDYFILDSVTGDLKTGKPLDRESLVDTSAPLNLTIRVIIFNIFYLYGIHMCVDNYNYGPNYLN